MASKTKYTKGLNLAKWIEIKATQKSKFLWWRQIRGTWYCVPNFFSWSCIRKRGYSIVSPTRFLFTRLTSRSCGGLRTEWVLTRNNPLFINTIGGLSVLFYEWKKHPCSPFNKLFLGGYNVPAKKEITYRGRRNLPGRFFMRFGSLFALERQQN